jgi:hypothetical protein
MRSETIFDVEGVVSEERPTCYGNWADCAPCQGCDIAVMCRRLQGRLQSRTRGLSRSRAQRAFCRSCVGGSAREGCTDTVCPHYAFLPAKKQLKGPPNLWWCAPSATWNEAEQRARGATSIYSVEADTEPDIDEDDGEES